MTVLHESHQATGAKNSLKIPCPFLAYNYYIGYLYDCALHRLIRSDLICEQKILGNKPITQIYKIATGFPKILACHSHSKQ